MVILVVGAVWNAQGIYNKRILKCNIRMVWKSNKE